MRSVLSIVTLSVVIFLSGCNEEQTTSGVWAGGEPVNVDHLKERAIEIVRDGLADENSYVRDRAVEVVLAAGRKEFMPTVRQLLKDDTVAVRFAAAIAIGDLGYSPAEYAVRRLLKDESGNVRIAAAYSLTKLGKGNFSDTIRRAVKSKDQMISSNAAMLLGKLGDRKDVKLLYQVIRDSDSSELARIEAVKAIATLGDERIYRPKSWPLLISVYHDYKIMGIKAMAALGTTDAKVAMQTMLYDDIQEVRLYAAMELGRLGDTSGESEVLEYLVKKPPSADEWSVADNTAAMAIGQIGGRSLTRFLPKFIDSRNKLIRLSAAQSVLLLTG